ncbi:DNA-binding response regulator, OmpR family, contains REC and winged-helix (wHTH) domain [Desulforamulus aeronauticus DSM 10349]|uniref:Stage 0 sporulation protein A homolog n=1 Tax=Desulforamulus aeronauticus DSM 10349 TaxID=1121421 RepID=A0A1M6X321_9FIRM|nr:DNA-binding response regulator, OmpR family, contains REC and winged-helix (wHTH) domain [Desulforamulus aeronauticus DSM 10349]SHK90317.1 DNA-binding response regulator, OmpR family, contains REC and winged-helix (wHTH) domain [Desulforamulus aeronauticus DSM 10349]SHL00301.1 DNA-binding response regulator, OmpR family, contains REC and winged-helix (wHTH) domain [Desulforamulus aeronauticus DSM 10349]
MEDEKRLADALTYILKKNNYGVDTAYDGETGQAMAETGVYDVIILDRMLPYKEGVEIVKALRTQGISTPVLLLTAKDSVENRIEGLDAGADDYLIKPFSTGELLARVRALGRRKLAQLGGEKIEAYGLTLDPLRCELTKGEEVIKLTLKESLLLELLMRNVGQVITKEQILDRVWGLDSDVEISNVETYVHYLRKKLTFSEVSIGTIRGVGYCLKGI